MPMTILSIPNFFAFTKVDMHNEFDRVIALPDESEEIRSVIGLSDALAVRKQYPNIILLN